jgi:hypothetical protein
MGLLRRSQAFALRGLIASPDGLYDGSFIAASIAWWNDLVENNSAVRSAGYAPLTKEDFLLLAHVPQPENRRLFEGLASAISLPGRLSAAVLCLAYAMAVIVEAAAARALGDEEEPVWQPAAVIANDQFDELSLHFSAEGWAREIDQWLPYWHQARNFLGDRAGDKIVGSLTKTFDDQVDRWAVAEGVDLRNSVGAPDAALVAAQEDDRIRFATFVDLLFEWGGRLRLAERLIANGNDLRDLRYERDESDFIQHLYSEAYERYVELAAEPDPVSADVQLAVRCLVEWIGADLTDGEQLALSTTAVRGYLWRTVEGGAVGFLEPELTETVTRSLTVGDDRGPNEPLGLRLYYAASQCIADGVNTRLGSLGGLMQGPRMYEMAFSDTTSDFAEHGLAVEDGKQRTAFQFGVCLADAERVLAPTLPS